MISIELLVSLKIPDVTAITARRALQNDMGYGDKLADLRRADWWLIEVDADATDAALAFGRELAEQTNLFVNPNKHSYEVVRGIAVPEAGEGIVAVPVLTGYRDDASSELTAGALRGRLGYGDRVGQLEHGTLWTLFLRESDRDAARRLAETMVVSNDRSSGLLANPHSMWWKFVEDAPVL